MEEEVTFGKLSTLSRKVAARLMRIKLNEVVLKINVNFLRPPP